MKRPKILFKTILLITIFATFGHVQKILATNKTYNNTRSPGVNSALTSGAGISELISRQDCVQKAGSTLQTVAWYSMGTMDARYWAPIHKNLFSFATADAYTGAAPAFTKITQADLDARLFILKLRTNIGVVPDPINEKVIGSLTFDPHQETYGFTLVFDQRLDTLLEGLYASITIPFAHIKNDLRPRFSGTNAFELKNYFTGKLISGTDDTNKQVPLRHALIGDADSKTGFADIDVIAGYTLFKNTHQQTSVNLGATIPTQTCALAADSTAHATAGGNSRLFPAGIGNRGHFGIGGGLTHDHRLFGNRDQHIALHAAINYRYLLEATEARTLGIKNEAYGQYKLLSPLKAYINPLTDDTVYVHTQDAALIPAANILTQNIFVTPGHTIDGALSLVYNNYDFSFLTGYNLYVRQEESITIDNNPLGQTQRYGLIKPTLLTNDPISEELTVLSSQDLDVSVAQTPSHTTHKLFFSTAWTFKTWSTYCNVGVGGHYEWAEKSRTIQNWGLNCSLTIGM